MTISVELLQLLHASHLLSNFLSTTVNTSHLYRIHSDIYSPFTHHNQDMKKHESMLALAAETATNSLFHMAHGAVLVRSGVVLATASNHLGGNRLSPNCPSTHAEIATLARWFGGSVKQCFEKPSNAKFSLEKSPESAFDPPESLRRVSGGSKQRQQRTIGRPASSSPRCLTLAERTGSYVKCAKRKDKGRKKTRSFRIWNKED